MRHKGFRVCNRPCATNHEIFVNHYRKDRDSGGFGSKYGEGIQGFLWNRRLLITYKRQRPISYSYISVSFFLYNSGPYLPYLSTTSQNSSSGSDRLNRYFPSVKTSVSLKKKGVTLLDQVLSPPGLGSLERVLCNKFSVPVLDLSRCVIGTPVYLNI